jgi:phosphoglycerate dehydrogenase-like enzyme
MTVRGEPLKVWVSESDLEYLDGVPASVEVTVYPRDGLLDPATAQAEFIVPHMDWPLALLESLPRLKALKVVQVLTAGVDWILPYVPTGAILCDASGVHDATVSEWVVGAILAAYKGFPRYRDLQREGRWEQEAGDDLAGKTVLILGYGSIGRALERRLEPFGVRILRVARRAREEVHPLREIETLVPQADIVAVLLPLTPATRGLLGRSFLERMREGALLVNAARGEIVDTEALIEALDAGRIRAVVDATNPEPLPRGHPLWGASGVFVTPHVAGVTKMFPERAYQLVREQIVRYLSREPLVNVVHEQGY